MSKAHVLFSTIDHQNRAETLAETIVTEHLAACVNIIPRVTSIYRWKETIHHDDEVILMIKTSSDTLGALKERLRELHPYEVPEIIVFEIKDGFDPYLQWIADQTRTS